MKVTVSFADLVHTGHSCNAIPYGISMVASYAHEYLGDKIEARIFKDPIDYIRYLEQELPKIACFSNYIWNLNLSYEFAKQIKIKSPETVIIFGGPNYPLDYEEQEAFLLSHPRIDFYIDREGEQAFVELLNCLFNHHFDVSYIKKCRLKIPNCHYIESGKVIRGVLLKPLEDLDQIPSPYLSGICDHFLDKELIPLLQTTRGCPFKCTYCQEGHEYYNGIRRFSLRRIKDEIEYIAQRTAVPNLMLGDANFGMYKEDLEICKEIALIQERYQWPAYFQGIDGKNQKDRVLQAASIVKGSQLTAAVQSTDKDVLNNIMRQNVSLNQMVQVAKEGDVTGANSFSEVILCLPGDTKNAHFKSVFDLIEAGINVVRSHQFIMLPGADASRKENRDRYEMETRLRVTPNTVKKYQLFGENFYAPEIDEICVANSSMLFKDYVECRLFDLTIEVFYNDGIFNELFEFLKLYNVSISSFIMNIHEKVRQKSARLSKLYDDFVRETNELFLNQDELSVVLKRPAIISSYESGEVGNNEQLMYRALAIFMNMGELHRIAFETIAKEMLEEKGCLNDQNRDYLEDLYQFSLLRKKDLLSTNKNEEKEFRYDFISLAGSNFKDSPISYKKPEGIRILFYHSDEQKMLINKYIEIYGLSNYGLGNMLSQAAHVGNLYRSVKRI